MHQGGAIHEVACMTGAFVSPLRLARIGSSFDGRCFRCGDQFGSKNHMIWQCPALRGTPPMPEDLLEKELGWPICAGQTGALQHMAKVRQECLQKRWRHEPSWGGWGGGGHLRIVLPSLVACCRAAAFVNVYYGWHDLRWPSTSSSTAPWSWRGLRRVGDGPEMWNWFFGDTWRIIPLSKWLITMVIVSPLRIGVSPLPNGHSWLINGGY